MIAAILAVALVAAWFVLYSRIRHLERRIVELEQRNRPAPTPVVENIPVLAAPAPEPAPPRVRQRLANREWEEIVGADWLNKLGVLVLVIGIALGLAYSFTYMGPWGRVATALSISAAMLASGVAIERRPVYATFGRGLLGGGWAGLYFTAYAMYGLSAAKVIDSAVIESVLLSAVAVAMIAHALRYRSQTVTLLAYFVAFITLGITPVTAFSVVALLPLAASVLYLAWRYDWNRMALAGVIATYVVCASRGDVGASLASAQSLIAAYWLIFEIFVLLRPGERWIFPLNALGATALSVAKWNSAAPGSLWMFFAGAAAIHVCASVVGIYISREWKPAALVGSLFAGVAVVLGCPAAWIAPALLAEGEILFILSLRFGQEFLEELAMAAFGASLARLVLIDAPRAHHAVWFGRSILTWTPTAAAAAVLFYVNRAFSRRGPIYVWAAAGSLLAAVAAEVDYRFVGLVWLVFAAANIEAGLRWGLRAFRLAGYVSGALACSYIFVVNVLFTGKPVPLTSTLVLFCASVICYLGAVRLVAVVGPRWFSSTAAAIFSAALIRAVLPDAYVGAGWSALMLALYWIGARRELIDFRWQGIWLALIVFFGTWAGTIERAAPVSFRVLGTALAAAGLYAAQLIAPRLVETGVWLARYQRAWFSVLATLLVTILLATELSGGVLTIGLGIQALGLLAAGFPLADRVLRLSALTLFFLCIGKLFLYDLRNLPTVDRIFSFIALGAIMVGVSWVYTRFRGRIHRYF